MKKLLIILLCVFIVAGCNKKDAETCCECKDCPQCDKCCSCN